MKKKIEVSDIRKIIIVPSMKRGEEKFTKEQHYVEYERIFITHIYLHRRKKPIKVVSKSVNEITKNF